MIAIDTNILAYAEGVNDFARRRQAREVLDRLDLGRTIIPVQVLGELFRVLTRKARFPVGEALRSVRSWAGNCQISDTSATTLLTAADLAAAHNLQIWDAIILQSAVEAGARVLLSEDMHNGFVWSGVTVVDPFTPGACAPLLAPYMT